MTIAIGVLCMFTIITLRDEYLLRMEERDFLRLQDKYRPHEENEENLLTGKRP